MDCSDLSGKGALITGGAKGIGGAVARRLTEAGARVLIVDVDDDHGHALAGELGGRYFHGDVSDPAVLDAAVTRAVESFGGLDIVHLNAGVADAMGMGDGFSLDRYRRIMGINLDGVVFGIHATLPALGARGGGSIIVTASMAGLTPAPFDPLYAANKAALVGLVRSSTGLVDSHKVTVNALCPSFADTDIIAPIRASLAESAFPILDVDDVVEGFMAILEANRTGECWYVVPGRVCEPFRFRNVPGPRT